MIRDHAFFMAVASVSVLCGRGHDKTGIRSSGNYLQLLSDIRLAWQSVCVSLCRSLYGTFLPMLAGKHPRYLGCFSTLVSC